MKKVPEIGDIWYRNNSNSRHYLILDTEAEGIDGLYKFLVLETGSYDTAYLEHFNVYCKFVQ